MSNQNTFPIRGTKVRMPYPPHPTPGEIRLTFALQKIFSPTQILTDCYFAKSSHSFSAQAQSTTTDNLTQIDCIAVDERGIFIFESKDYSGWIYGSSEQNNWTEVLNFGREKHHFYNPIRQNMLHLETIRGIFNHEKLNLYSIIVFGRDANLKTVPKSNSTTIICTQNNLLNHLSQINPSTKLNDDQQKSIVETLYASLTIPTTIIRQNHIEEIESKGNHYG